MTTLPQVLAKGLLADRPTSGIPVGSLYFSTDTVELHQWDGDSWEVYGTAGPAGPAGEDGPAGPAGADGATGPTGPAGGGMVDPTTTLGDLIVNDGSGVDRLAVGTEGQVPVARAAAPLGIAWEAPASGFANPTTTKGDLIVHDGSDPVRLPVGSNGQVPVARSGDAEGVVWENRDTTLTFGFPDAAAAQTVEAEIGFAYTIVAARIFSPVSGSATFSVDKATYANYPTFTAIDAAAPPTLTGASKAQDTTLTGWTVDGDAGDVLRATLDSVTTTTALSLALTLRRR